jgi:hypothetical protein
VGTYFSIKNTGGPRERAFMIRLSAIAWVTISLFLLALWALPQPYKWLLWIPYGVALPLAIAWGNRRQLRIRAEEAGSLQDRSRL